MKQLNIEGKYLQNYYYRNHNFMVHEDNQQLILDGPAFTDLSTDMSTESVLVGDHGTGSTLLTVNDTSNMYEGMPLDYEVTGIAYGTFIEFVNGSNQITINQGLLDEVHDGTQMISNKNGFEVFVVDEYGNKTELIKDTDYTVIPSVNGLSRVLLEYSSPGSYDKELADGIEVLTSSANLPSSYPYRIIISYRTLDHLDAITTTTVTDLLDSFRTFGKDLTGDYDENHVCDERHYVNLPAGQLVLVPMAGAFYNHDIQIKSEPVDYILNGDHSSGVTTLNFVDITGYYPTHSYSAGATEINLNSAQGLYPGLPLNDSLSAVAGGTYIKSINGTEIHLSHSLLEDIDPSDDILSTPQLEVGDIVDSSIDGIQENTTVVSVSASGNTVEIDKPLTQLVGDGSEIPFIHLWRKNADFVVAGADLAKTEMTYCSSGVFDFIVLTKPSYVGEIKISYHAFGGEVSRWDFDELRGAVANIMRFLDQGIFTVDEHVGEANPHPVYQLRSEKGVPHGYPDLDENGVVPVDQLPDFVLGSLTYRGTWSAEIHSDYPQYNGEGPDNFTVAVNQTSGTNTLELTSMTGISIGDVVYGHSSIPSDTSITDIDSDGMYITLSNDLTGDVNSGDEITVNYTVRQGDYWVISEAGNLIQPSYPYPVDYTVDGAHSSGVDVIKLTSVISLQPGDTMDDSHSAIPSGTEITAVNTDTREITLNNTTVDNLTDGETLPVFNTAAHYDVGDWIIYAGTHWDKLSRNPAAEITAHVGDVDPQQMTHDPHPYYQFRGEKDQPGGYAGLETDILGRTTQLKDEEALNLQTFDAVVYTAGEFIQACQNSNIRSIYVKSMNSDIDQDITLGYDNQTKIIRGERSGDPGHAAQIRMINGHRIIVQSDYTTIFENLSIVHNESGSCLLDMQDNGFGGDIFFHQCYLKGVSGDSYIIEGNGNEITQTVFSHCLFEDYESGDLFRNFTVSKGMGLIGNRGETSSAEARQTLRIVLDSYLEADTLEGMHADQDPVMSEEFMTKTEPADHDKTGDPDNLVTRFNVIDYFKNLPVTRAGKLSYLPPDIKTKAKGIIGRGGNKYYFEEVNGDIFGLYLSLAGFDENARKGRNYYCLYSYLTHDPSNPDIPIINQTDIEYRPPFLNEDERVIMILSQNNHGFLAVIWKHSPDPYTNNWYIQNNAKLYWISVKGSMQDSDTPERILGSHGTLDDSEHSFVDLSHLNEFLSDEEGILGDFYHSNGINNIKITYVPEKDVFVVIPHNGYENNQDTFAVYILDRQDVIDNRDTPTNITPLARRAFLSPSPEFIHYDQLNGYDWYRFRNRPRFMVCTVISNELHIGLGVGIEPYYPAAAGGNSPNDGMACFFKWDESQSMDNAVIKLGPQGTDPSAENYLSIDPANIGATDEGKYFIYNGLRRRSMDLFFFNNAYYDTWEHGRYYPFHIYKRTDSIPSSQDWIEYGFKITSQESTGSYERNPYLNIVDTSLLGKWIRSVFFISNNTYVARVESYTQADQDAGDNNSNKSHYRIISRDGLNSVSDWSSFISTSGFFTTRGSDQKISQPKESEIYINDETPDPNYFSDPDVLRLTTIRRGIDDLWRGKEGNWDQISGHMFDVSDEKIKTVLAVNETDDNFVLFNSKIQEGVFNGVDATDVVTISDLISLPAYSNTSGLTDWDSGTEYSSGDFVRYDCKTYESLQNGNIGNIPHNNLSYWEPKDWLGQIENIIEAEQDLVDSNPSLDIFPEDNETYFDRQSYYLSYLTNDLFLLEYGVRKGTIREFQVRAKLLSFDGSVFTETSNPVIVYPDYPPYDSGNTYSRHDVVRYYDGIYVSLHNSNTGNNPKTSSAYWKEIGYVDEWDSGASYEDDDLVMYENHLYIADVDTSNEPEDGSGDWTQIGWEDAFRTGVNFNIYHHGSGLMVYNSSEGYFYGGCGGINYSGNNVLPVIVIKFDPTNKNIINLIVTHTPKSWQTDFRGVHPYFGFYGQADSIAYEQYFYYQEETGSYPPDGTNKADRIRASAESWLTNGFSTDTHITSLTISPKIGFEIRIDDLPVILSSRSYYIDGFTFNLSDRVADPTNNTFYLFARVENDQPQIVVSEEKMDNTFYQIYLGYVVTDDEGIVDMDLEKPSLLNKYGTSKTPQPNSMPVARNDGKIDREWIDNAYDIIAHNVQEFVEACSDEDVTSIYVKYDQMNTFHINQNIQFRGKHKFITGENTPDPNWGKCISLIDGAHFITDTVNQGCTSIRFENITIRTETEDSSGYYIIEYTDDGDGSDCGQLMFSHCQIGGTDSDDATTNYIIEGNGISLAHCMFVNCIFEKYHHIDLFQNLSVGGGVKIIGCDGERISSEVVEYLHTYSDSKNDADTVDGYNADNEDVEDGDQQNLTTKEQIQIHVEREAIKWSIVLG